MASSRPFSSIHVPSSQVPNHETSFAHKRRSGRCGRHRLCAAASRGRGGARSNGGRPLYSSIAAAPGLTHTILMSVVL